jgi:hypothetical protein
MQLFLGTKTRESLPERVSGMSKDKVNVLLLQIIDYLLRSRSGLIFEPQRCYDA